MSTPRDRLNKIRSMSTGVIALAPTRGGRSGDDGTIYARARLDRAEITEDYFVSQGISKNPSIEVGAPPTGRIELAVPYDGCRYFTRQAIDDVSQAIDAQTTVDGAAVVGHLLFQDYDRTSLGDSLQLRDKHDSIPIKVEVRRDQDGTLDFLSADRQTCVTRIEFEPVTPDLNLASLNIELFDPDSLDLPELDLMKVDLSGGGDPRRAEENRRRVGDVVDKIRQQVSFQNELVLGMVVSVSVPVRRMRRDRQPTRPAPEITRMTIGWPTITSLRTLHLRMGDRLLDEGADVKYRDAAVRYNPAQKCLEWGKVPMFQSKLTEADDGIDIIEYKSAAMLLAIRHPGELYKQPTLEACARVKIPGYLLSGLTARLFDATGHRSEDPTLTTGICVTADLTLDDAFAIRLRSPYQHLFFDEIIPDEMRITDIITALKDRGFEVLRILPTDQQLQQGHVVGAGTVNWLLAARRQEGPDTMDLWIFVEGRNFETERETTAFGGGVTHKTKLNSGELRVFIRGTLARESGKLTHEMNALQQTLRDRFERVRQRR